jgi:glycosyltransferase involved in cell wall biosynthesis
MNLSELMALGPRPFPPCLVYFHENQLTYPGSSGRTRDVQAAWTNVTTALAADRVFFNSQAQRELFLESLPVLIRTMPDYRPGWVTEAIQRKSSVLYPGCRFPAEKPLLSVWDKDALPLIIWNHRWEFDKNPEAFFQALDRLCERGLEFRLALLGQRFQKIPGSFARARKKYADHIVQDGFAKSREDYIEWLKRGTLVVSTAIQENFGISVVEAVRYGCLPVLPKRLSYPELIPERYHAACLYEDQEGLIQRLVDILTRPMDFLDHRERLSESMGRFSWESQIDKYDRVLTELAASRTRA